MDVIVMESTGYNALVQQLNLMEKLFLQAISELKEAKNERYLSVHEVSELTGFGKDLFPAPKR